MRYEAKNSGFLPKKVVVFKQSEVPYRHHNEPLETLLREEIAVLKKCLTVWAHLYRGKNYPYRITKKNSRFDLCILVWHIFSGWVCDHSVRLHNCSQVAAEPAAADGQFIKRCHFFACFCYRKKGWPNRRPTLSSRTDAFGRRLGDPPIHRRIDEVRFWMLFGWP